MNASIPLQDISIVHNRSGQTIEQAGPLKSVIHRASALGLSVPEIASALQLVSQQGMDAAFAAHPVFKQAFEKYIAEARAQGSTQNAARGISRRAVLMATGFAVPPFSLGAGMVVNAVVNDDKSANERKKEATYGLVLAALSIALGVYTVKYSVSTAREEKFIPPNAILPDTVQAKAAIATLEAKIRDAAEAQGVAFREQRVR